MARLGSKLTAGTLLGIMVFAIAGIYFLDVITDKVTCTQAMVTAGDCTQAQYDAHEQVTQYKLPELGETKTATQGIIKYIIVGLAVWIGYYIITKLMNETMNRKHLFTLVVIGIVVIALWHYVLHPIWGASSLDAIEWKTAMKLGLAP